jgi:ketosteroid isomerase-like protein
MGRPATGKHYAFRGASGFELRDGKIMRCCDYWNLTTLLDQLESDER